MTETFIHNRISIAYSLTGSGPVCVLAHGAGANRSYWKNLSQALTQRQIIMPDFFGHGETPAWQSPSDIQRRYSYQDDVSLLSALIQKFDSPIDLVGHSSGGSICLEYARQFPDRVRRIVLIEPMLPTVLKETAIAAWSEIFSAYERAHAKVDCGHFTEAAHDLFEYILGDGEWELLPDKVKNWMSKNVHSTLSAHSRASLAHAVPPEAYSTVQMKTLVIYGAKTRDPYKVMCQELAQLLPSSQLEEISEASHNLILTHTVIANKIVKEFLECAA